MPMKPLTLIAAVVCLAAWVFLGFVMPVGVGIVHALLGVGVILLVRWWGLTA